MKKTNTISAQVILKTSSKAVKNKAVTSKNISTFKPDESTIKKTSAILKKAGFEVEPSPTTISITSEPGNFKKYFHIDTFTKASANEPQELTVPDELKEFVSNIVLPYKPELF